MRKLALLFLFFFLAIISSHSPADSASTPVSPNVPAPELSFDVSHIGGQTSEALLVEGNYAYLAMGRYLMIMDVSDPGHPVQVSSLQVLSYDTNMVDIVKRDSQVFVAGLAGLWIIDVGDVTHPILLGMFYPYGPGSSALSVAVAGNYAYVGFDHGFYVVDISDPRNPVQTGAYIGLHGIYDISVAGTYAYVALAETGSDFNGLGVVDVSDPSAPALVTLSQLKIPASGLAIAGQYAYLAQEGLKVYDISNPALPEVGSCDCTGGDLGRRVAIQGNYAYITAGGYGLVIIDVSDPTHPVQTGVYDPLPDDRLQVRDVSVVGNYAYIALGSPGGLISLDVTNPSAPIRLGGFVGPGLTWSAALTSHYVYVMDDLGLNVFDRLSPGTSPASGDLTPLGYAEIGGESWGLAVHYPYAYVALGMQGLGIVDISDPTQPVFIGVSDVITEAYRVVVSGAYAYVLGFYTSDLHVLDVTNPISPTEVGSLSFPGGWVSDDITVSGHYVFVSSGGATSGFRIVDVSDPRSPAIVGGFTSSIPHFGIAVQGQYAYLAVFRNPALRVWDISNLTLPVYIGGGDSPGERSLFIKVSGRYAYLSNANSIYVFDVDNPASPELIGIYDRGFLTFSVLVDENSVFLTTENGLEILRTLTEKMTFPIEPAGGSYTSSAGDIQLIFPSGAFTQTADVTYKHLLVDQDTGDLLGIGSTFELSAVYSDNLYTAALAPGETFTITVSYTVPQLGGVIEDTLALYGWDGSQWVRDPTSSLDTASHTLTAASDRFTLWAVLGETKRLYLPVMIY